MLLVFLKWDITADQHVKGYIAPTIHLKKEGKLKERKTHLV